MVGVNFATQSLSSGANTSVTRKSTLDYDSFLKLLVTQMKNQDPTKPMDSTEYIAQLASFSNVEQSISMNKKLDSLLQQTRISQGVSLIGKFVSSLDNMGAGIVESVRFTGDSIVVA
ncbi:MAG: flagellar hook assembly protein FlgD, partial [Rhizobiaceae bacterium]